MNTGHRLPNISTKLKNVQFKMAESSSEICSLGGNDSSVTHQPCTLYCTVCRWMVSECKPTDFHLTGKIKPKKSSQLHTVAHYGACAILLHFKIVYEFHVKSSVIIAISTCTHACFSHRSESSEKL